MRSCSEYFFELTLASHTFRDCATAGRERDAHLPGCSYMSGAPRKSKLLKKAKKKKHTDTHTKEAASRQGYTILHAYSMYMRQGLLKSGLPGGTPTRSTRVALGSTLVCTPSPGSLLRRILAMHTSSNSLVHDFAVDFAGQSHVRVGR